MSDPPQHRSRPRLLLLIPHLGGGGAEQVTALLAGGLSPLKYDLHLAVITQSASASALVNAPLPPTVTVHPLGAPRVRSSAISLLLLLRRLRPRLIICSMFHLNFLVLLLRPFLGFRVRILVRQNGTASAALVPLPRYYRLLYRLLYPLADCVLCQSAAMARELHRCCAIPMRRLRVLPNPIDFDALRTTPPASPETWPDRGPHILAVGRLSAEKGFDLLLKSLPIVRERFPFADLVIAGAGREEHALKTLCQTLALDTAVRFPGQVNAPAAYFPTSALFVLSSYHEGLPNALLEAAASGLPIVTTRASDGLVELVDRHPGVWLAPESTSESLAQTLITALTELEPGQRFQHTFGQPFRMNTALAAWEMLIDGFISGAPNAAVPARSGSTVASA